MDLTKEYCQLGVVHGLHGIHGEVILFLTIKEFDKIQKLSSVFLALNDQFTPFFVESFSVKKNKAIVQFEGIQSAEQATLLLECLVYIPLTHIAKPEGVSFHFQELIGFQVFDKLAGLVGVIESVLDFPQQQLFQIKDAANNEILIPARKEFILGIDTDARRVELETPEGLIDLYIKNI